MSEDQNPKEGAVSGDEPVTPTPPPETPPTPLPEGAKLEVAEGVMKVDGRKVVFESDLIAAKRSLEQQAEQAQTVHNQAIDKAKIDLSDSQQQVATANAKVQQLEQASKSGAVSDEDAARSKQEIDAAKGSAEQATAKALEYRRALMAKEYSIPVGQLQEKDMSQLDSFEEALKAVSQSRGVGNYATGGTGGGAAPETPMDRATRILETTPVRGTRTATTQ